MKQRYLCLVFAVLATCSNLLWAEAPISLHPENPHYFLWRGEPTVLVTSAEHYGALLNSDFDFKPYLAALQSHGFNLTRTFSGAYCEDATSFNIKRNTLAPKKGKFIAPWARSDKPGYAGGGNKFDLTKWNPVYFKRLHAFMTEASKRGVVVEFVFFCPFYRDTMWNISPMKASNNINGVGNATRTNVYALKHDDLQKAQEALVRKIVQELRSFDNLYYEICNEPYCGGVTLEWQARIAQVIAKTEKDFPQKHLIAQNIANKRKKIEKPNPLVSIFNFHYAKPPDTVYDNYGLNRVIGDDETGFSGSEPKAYRLEAWDFLMAGGAVFNNLDYSFSVGKEKGDDKIEAPGGGGQTYRKQLEIARDFLTSMDFIKARPDNSVIAGGVPPKATARALVLKGKTYAIYVNGGSQANLSLRLEPGTYEAQWTDTKTGKVAKQETFTHKKGTREIKSPKYQDDIALKVVRK